MDYTEEQEQEIIADQLKKRSRLVKNIIAHNKISHSPILLYGHWGSGKSVLIREVNELIENKENKRLQEHNLSNHQIPRHCFFYERVSPFYTSSKPTDREIIGWIIEESNSYDQTIIITFTNYDTYERVKKLTGLKGYELHKKGCMPHRRVRNPKLATEMGW